MEVKTLKGLEVYNGNNYDRKKVLLYRPGERGTAVADLMWLTTDSQFGEGDIHKSSYDNLKITLKGGVP